LNLLFAHDHIFYKYGDVYYSNGSFPQKTLKRYTRVFDKVNFVSRQIIVDEKPNEISLASTENLEFVRVPNFKTIKDFYKIKEAKEIIKREVENADCIIARTSSIGSLAVRYAKKYNKPYLIEVVGCTKDALWNHGSLAGKLLSFPKYFKSKKMIKEAPYVIYVTSEFLQKRYPTLGLYTNCSNVNITKGSERTLENRLIKINNNNSKIVFGTIGAIDIEYKGHDLMIKALSLIKDNVTKEIEYKIVGGGNPIHLINLAKKYDVLDLVTFEGTLENDEINNFLDSVDIYIQPSRTEGLPRAVIEAMSRACPIIGSNVGGIPELIDKESIFKKNNYKELANLILDVSSNKIWLENKAKRNFNESKKYENTIIEERRTQFLNEFKKEIYLNKRFVNI